MNTHKHDEPPRPWEVLAAYLYTLDLDDPALAWEYLRRHVGYQADWRVLGRNANAERWGLRQRRGPEPGCA